MPTIRKYTGEISGSVTGTVLSLTRPDLGTIVAHYKTPDFGEGSFTLTDKDGAGVFTGRYDDAHCKGPALMTIAKEEGDELVLHGSFDGGFWEWHLTLEEAEQDCLCG